MKTKSIALIIAFRDFNDEEFLIPKNMFLKKGFKVVVASSETGTAIGSYGLEVNVETLIQEIKIKDFDAIIFVGGSGSSKYFADPACYSLALKAVLSNKVLGAICIAPCILAKAGVLKNKKATVWSSNLDKSFIKILKQEKANYLSTPVVTDHNLITASGPAYARAFGQKIIDKL